MNRPRVSQIVVDVFSMFVDDQDKKGLKKYNRTIDDANDKDYNWNVMVIEECVDAMKYFTRELLRLNGEITVKDKEIRKLKFENQHLRMLMERVNGGE
jgi:hypothetical protein